jgi:superfamily II DNA or RNA helicase
MLRLIVDDLETRLDGVFPHKDIYEATSFLRPNSWFNPYVRKGLSDGRKRFLKAARGQKLACFPTGLLTAVTEALSKRNWAFELEDNRGDCSFEPRYTLQSEDGVMDMRKYPYDYQGACIDDVATYGRGVIKFATNGGKTNTAAGIINSAQRKTLWLTNRRSLAHQTRRRLKEYLDLEIGLVGDSIYEPSDITVCMSQTLAKLRKSGDSAFDFVRDAQIIIADEVHHATSQEWYDILMEVKAPIRIGLSATPPSNGFGMFLTATTGPIIKEVSAQELLERGINVPPYFWFATVDGPKLPAKLKGNDVVDQGVIYNKDRNLLAAHIAKIFIRERKPPLLAVNRLNHVDILCGILNSSGIDAKKITGSVPDDQRIRYLRGLSTGETQCIVGMTSVIAEGLDIPDVRAVINCTGSRGGSGVDGKSGQQVVQIIGRGLRRGKATRYLPEKTRFDYVTFLDMGHKSLRDNSVAQLNAIEGQGYSPWVRRWSDYVPAAS